MMTIEEKIIELLMMQGLFREEAEEVIRYFNDNHQGLDYPWDADFELQRPGFIFNVYYVIRREALWWIDRHSDRFSAERRRRCQDNLK